MSTTMLSLRLPSIRLGQGHGPAQFALGYVTTNLLQNPLSDGVDQGGGPPRLKAFREAAFRPKAEFGRDHFDQCIQGLIPLPKMFDFLDSVKNGGVVATVVESSDSGRAQSCLASITFPGQRQLFLPTATITNLLTDLLFLYTDPDRSRG
jgi:hypothetical protein